MWGLSRPRPPPQTPPAAETLAAPPAAFGLTYYGLVLDYDPARWAAQGQELVSRATPSCRIREQGPTEIPQPIPAPASRDALPCAL